MSKFPEKNTKAANGRAKNLKTHTIASHNQVSPGERLIQLVKLLARHAAESDFHTHANTPRHLDQGGKNYDTTH